MTAETMAETFKSKRLTCVYSFPNEFLFGQKYPQTRYLARNPTKREFQAGLVNTWDPTKYFN